MMKKRIFILYLIAVHILLGTALLKSDFIARVERKLGFTPPENEISEHYQRMTIFHSRMDENVPNQSVIFIGASHIQGLPVAAVATPSVNYGIGGDTSIGVLQRLPIYRSINNAKAVVINIGGNDMKYRSNSDLLSNLKSIVGQIPKGIPIIFSAILPIDEKSKKEFIGRSNKRINELNSKLKDWTDSSDKLFYVDSAPSLSDENGNLADQFHIGDGLHLNSKGYAIWIQQLKIALESSQQ